MDEPYTKPEIATERAQCKALRDHVLEDGGCCYCKHRAPMFDGIGRRALCGLPIPKAFPRCVEELGGFDFDDLALVRSAP